MRTRQHGFSLIEVIVVISLTGIVAGLVASITSRPLLGYVHATRRAELVDTGDHSLRRLGRDLRRALPNSIRVAGGARVIEFLNVVDGARYRLGGGINPTTSVDHTAASDTVDFAGDTSFNVLGRFNELAFGYGVPLAGGHRAAIYTTGAGLWSDAASGANPGVITPIATSITVLDDGDEDQIVLSAPFQFSLQSPRQRVFLVDGPVTYLCSVANETLTRYSNYAISAVQPSDPSVPPLSGASAALLANSVTSCSFTYTAGTTARGGLVTTDLTLARADERIRLLEETHVVNTP